MIRTDRPDSDALLQKWAQQVHDLVPNMLYDSAKCFGHRIPLRGCVCENYVEKRIELHLHALASVCAGGAVTCNQDICIRFKRCGCPSMPEFPQDVSLHATTKAALFVCGKCNKKRAMFIDIGQFVKQPERMDSSPILRLPSLIRLQSLDDCLRGWRHMPDRTHPIACVKSGFRENRELSLFSGGKRQATAVRFRQSKGEMIKRGPNIIEAISYEHGKSRRRSAGSSDANRIFLPIQIELMGNLIGFIAQPSPEFVIHGAQMLTRAI